MSEKKGNQAQQRIDDALAFVEEHGRICEGEHHKQWLLDQIIRILTGEEYDEWVELYEEPLYDEDDLECFGVSYEWETGLAP